MMRPIHSVFLRILFEKKEMKFYFNQTILLADVESIQKVPILHYEKRKKSSANDLMRQV